MNAPVVDAHVHFWDPRRLRHPWLDDLPALNRPFLPEDFRVASATANVAKLVFVECGCDSLQGYQEMKWVEELAQHEPRLKAIVVHASLEQGCLARRQLESLVRSPLVRGVRRLLQSESDPEFCLRPGFVAGVQLLGGFGLSFDLCIRHEQLPSVTELARRCPQVCMVLDHLGKPGIKKREFQPWAQHFKELAALPNVWCKISGLTTEADITSWKPEDLRPYLEHAFECFGFDRVMFGGDWPVSTLATSYERWLETVSAAAASASEAERRQLFQENAERFYRV